MSLATDKNDHTERMSLKYSLESRAFIDWEAITFSQIMTY